MIITRPALPMEESLPALTFQSFPEYCLQSLAQWDQVLLAISHHLLTQLNLVNHTCGMQKEDEVRSVRKHWPHNLLVRSAEALQRC